MDDETELAGMYCPGCQQHAQMMLAGGVQAFCGNVDCHVFMWNPEMSVAQLSTTAAFVELPDWLPSADQSERERDES